MLDSAQMLTKGLHDDGLGLGWGIVKFLTWQFRANRVSIPGKKLPDFLQPKLGMSSCHFIYILLVE